MAKIATLITNLYEDSKFTEPTQAFEEEGHEVVTIEKEVGNEIEGKQGGKLAVDKGIDDVKAEDFAALLLPGGFSPDQLRADDRFVKFTKHFMDEKIPLENGEILRFLAVFLCYIPSKNNLHFT